MHAEDIQGTMDTATLAEKTFAGLLYGLQKITDPSDTLTEEAVDLAWMRLLIVNVTFVGLPNSRWVLVDAGLPGSAGAIFKAAQHRFGDRRPEAIILTHGHFDHVGSIKELLRRWDVPVYAHEEELPYLRGEADYMEPDPGVDPGMMAKVSPLYPTEAIDLGSFVQPLPADGAVPPLPDWRWVHTPGHTPGHVCFFRDEDRALIVGDAFTTVDQESAMKVMSQAREVHGPPKYLTPDWEEAWESIRILEALKPSLAMVSHGVPIRGDELSAYLQALSENFDRIAVPEAS